MYQCCSSVVACEIEMSLDNTHYEALAEQIESILRHPERAIEHIRDERTRRRLVEGGCKLSAALEQPKETFRRVGYSVGI